ncbi:hypothetical protein SAY87_012496 [Trapa incisa]|uniref:BRCT domain-containing protein n=1 Tax=Trapa incisa TaxID=236973 RepID=A0AAN7JIX9_9MYRT|nr:hypothetical protein SAY87_012496 [Trapa incisa]
MKDMRSFHVGSEEREHIQRESLNLDYEGDTQLLDSQPLNSPSPDNDEIVATTLSDQHFPECTVPYDDTVPVDGESETQILNPDEKPQGVDCYTETQIIDSQGDYIDNLETQLLDEFDTQIIDDCESEELCRTERLGEDNYPIDDDSTSKSIGDSIDKKNMQLSAPCKSGTLKGFTSIRTASVRASGLAAAKACSKQSNSLSSKLLSNGQFSEKAASKVHGHPRVTVSSNFEEEYDQKQASRKLGDRLEDSRDGNKCKVGSSAVRRLFIEDDNFKMIGNCTNKGDEDLNIGGLSYVDSQDPCDLSQANALDFVDQFLKDNLDDLNKGLSVGMTAGGKSAPVPSARGPQLLAATIATTGNTGIFDWDDNMEDEGGGDIFCRRKDEFFKGESLIQSRTQLQKKLRGSILDKSRPNNEQLNPREKTRGLVRSAPTVKFTAQGETRKNIKVRNLSDEFFAVPAGESLRGQTEETCDVGPDTQLAAEAMQTLCQDKSLSEKDERENGELQSILRKGRKKDLDLPTKCTRQFKRRGESNSALRNKSPISLGRSKNTKNCKKKTKVNIREKTSTHTHSDSLDIPCSNRELNNGKLEDKVHEVGKNGGFFTPVAHRTRLSKASTESIRAESRNNLHNETIHVAEIDNHQVKKVQSKQSVRVEGSGEEPVLRRKRSCNEGMVTTSCGKKKTRSSKQKRVINDLIVQMGAEDSSTEAGRNKSLSAKIVSTQAEANESPSKRSKLSKAACITPSCPTPSNNASPVCVGNEYSNKQSCRKNLSWFSLSKEVKSLISSSMPELSPASMDTRRKWRDMADVRVLCSRHLDEDTIKHQKKILAHLGASEASSISNATHFVTDKFVRTRNMLEAIALGKPVVTHLWLESCGQASCFLDEKNYILRDPKKEREIGFSMPTSLSCASKHPLLQDVRVLITMNVKPSKEIISSLVRAVGGQPTERVGRSLMRDDEVPEDLLILSCEEDYDICVPFLEKGASVHSSELLLNGIVIQKLEYERHRLFIDKVKTTPSHSDVIRLKKNRRKFVAVATKHGKQ